MHTAPLQHLAPGPRPPVAPPTRNPVRTHVSALHVAPRPSPTLATAACSLVRLSRRRGPGAAAPRERDEAAGVDAAVGFLAGPGPPCHGGRLLHCWPLNLRHWPQVQHPQPLHWAAPSFFTFSLSPSLSPSLTRSLVLARSLAPSLTLSLKFSLTYPFHPPIAASGDGLKPKTNSTLSPSLSLPRSPFPLSALPLSSPLPHRSLAL
eukprot:1594141-Rhodomonas_salina.1